MEIYHTRLSGAVEGCRVLLYLLPIALASVSDAHEKLYVLIHFYNHFWPNGMSSASNSANSNFALFTYIPKYYWSKFLFLIFYITILNSDSDVFNQ